MTSTNLLKKLAQWDSMIYARPHEPKAYIQRGMVHFQLADINAAIADFDMAEIIEPELKPYLWQRGLAYYYAGRFGDGARQFEEDLTVNFEDLEESLWRYLCLAQLNGPVPARECLLGGKNDPRWVIGLVYDLYAGRYGVDDFLSLSQRKDKKSQFYTYLYLGLYYEVHQQPELTRQYIDQAVQTKIDDYMWHLAAVHQKLRGWESPES